jgi:hypothetical protein
MPQVQLNLSTTLVMSSDRERRLVAGMDNRCRQAMRRRNLSAGEELGGVATPKSGWLP